MMVEVYSTNVKEHFQANFAINQLQKLFPNYVITFDLEDCDRILRVECVSGLVKVNEVSAALEKMGFEAIPLKDVA